MCEGPGFSDVAIRWDIPSVFADPVLAPRLVDLDGDGLLDLLVVRDEANPAVGSSIWRTHRNTGEGFAAGEDWTLPVIPGAAGLTATVMDYCEEGGALRSSLVDVTSDGLLDLVVTQGCEGASGWRVYPGSEGGFSQTPMVWTAPAVAGEPVEALADGMAICPDGGAVPLTVAEMSGDTRPDLLAYRGCEAGGWQVWIAGEAGYPSSPVVWGVPEVAEGRAVTHPAGAVSERIVNTCRWQQGASFLADLTGSGRVDLVVTDACDRAGVGTEHWLRFENRGSSFAAEPTVWALPGPPRLDAFDRDRGERGCIREGAPRVRENLLPETGWRYRLRDMTADGRPDLVVTESCGVSPDRWSVYRNTGADFAAEAADWCLPAAALAEGTLPELGPAERRCSEGDRARYETMELTGDGCPDLVLKGSCQDPEVGRTHWRVFPGSCE